MVFPLFGGILLRRVKFSHHFDGVIIGCNVDATWSQHVLVTVGIRNEKRTTISIGYEDNHQFNTIKEGSNQRREMDLCPTG